MIDRVLAEIAHEKLNKLHDALKAVAPIVGVEAADFDDSSTWKVHWEVGYTPTQENLKAVAAVIAAFPKRLR